MANIRKVDEAEYNSYKDNARKKLTGAVGEGLTKVNYQESLMSGVSALSQNNESDVQPDISIDGNIVNCLDNIIGRFKIRYGQGLTLIAYGDPQVYKVGMDVRVNVPNGDFEKEKVIIAQINKTAPINELDMSSVADVGVIFKYTGEIEINNNIASNKVDVVTLPTVNYSNDGGGRDYSKFASANTYYLEATFEVTCDDIDKLLFSDSDCAFNFGIVVEQLYLTSGRYLSRSFTLDLDNMRGNPYYFSEDNKLIIKQQYTIDIGETESLLPFFAGMRDLRNLYLFVENKPSVNINYSVTVKDIKAIAKFRLIEEDFANYELILEPKDDKIEIERDSEYLEIKAIISRGAGRVVPSDLPNLQYFWFARNLSVVEPDSEKDKRYSPDAGLGWEKLDCTTDVLIVNNKMIMSKSRMFKCIAKFKNTRLSAEIELFNLNGIDIVVEELNGETVFTKESEDPPTLQCFIDEELVQPQVVGSEESPQYFWWKADKPCVDEVGNSYEWIVNDISSINNMGEVKFLCGVNRYDTDTREMIYLGDGYINLEYVSYKGSSNKGEGGPPPIWAFRIITDGEFYIDTEEDEEHYLDVEENEPET